MLHKKYLINGKWNIIKLHTGSKIDKFKIAAFLDKNHVTKHFKTKMFIAVSECMSFLQRGSVS